MFNNIELESIDEGLMLLNRCPQCKQEDIGLQKVVNRNGYSYNLICKHCGYMKSIIEFNEDIPTDTGLLDVTINGKKTNLIVDKYDMDKKTLNLIVHKKDLELVDMLDNIIDNNYPHQRRLCNQINKLLMNTRSSYKYFKAIGIDNGCILIKVISIIKHSQMNAYKKDLSFILNIPMAYISHFYNKEEHYLVVNCKAYCEQNYGDY